MGQPRQWLKEILDELCDYHKEVRAHPGRGRENMCTFLASTHPGAELRGVPPQGDHRLTWSLKPAYRNM